MTTLAGLHSLIAQGDSKAIEFKRSTAELKRAGETLFAFLNSDGGRVLIGVAPSGKLVGRNLANTALRDIASILGRGHREVQGGGLRRGEGLGSR